MPHRQFLVVDGHSLFRRTVALVARQLQIAEVHECSSHEAAQRLLEHRPMDGLLLDIGEGLQALALVQSVRAGGLRCPAQMPIALTAEACDLATAQLYRDLDIRRIMLKPFKVKTALEVIQDLARPAPTAAARPGAASSNSRDAGGPGGPRPPH